MNQVVRSLTPSGYKMGDKFTLTVIVNCEILTASHDAREHYSGRGAKYNNSIRHGNIEVTMTVAELNRAYKPIAERAVAKKKYEAEQKKYQATCNEPAQLVEAAAKAVNVIGVPGYLALGLTEAETREKYTGAKLEFWLKPDTGYRGCGVYRVGFKNGVKTCTVHGGFHDSTPYGVDKSKWAEAVENEMMKYSEVVVKMDGSGTEFFFRNFEDADKCVIATEVYFVPDLTTGGRHLNIQEAFAIIGSPNQLSS